MHVTCHPSPNFGDRRGGADPDLIVLHYTAMASAKAALNWLCSEKSAVSAHYLLSEQGEVFQLVAEDMRAWHAGAGAWGAWGDVNSASIGIELANDGFSPFGAAQMDALETLLADIMARRNIAPRGVIGHCDMAPGRKIDPGSRFDWRRLALGGMSIWPKPDGAQEPDTKLFLAHAASFGYPVTGKFQPLLKAFRLRFRPWATGPLQATDMALINDLARRFGVDPDAASA